eukprot:1063559-Prymnesium_polylepis.1
MAGYSVRWTTSSEFITVTIAAETTGWVGFGFASSGGMHGADIMIGLVDDISGTGEIGDYWSADNGLPKLDAQQDWSLITASQSDGVTTLSAKRRLITSDNEDWPLKSSLPHARII